MKNSSTPCSKSPQDSKKSEDSACRKRKSFSPILKTTSSGGALLNGDERISSKRYVRCDVCGRPDPEADNCLVICSGCDVAVHQTCYGIAYIPEGPWYCHRCAVGCDSDKTKCVLCGQTEGAMLPIGMLTEPPEGKHREWAHALCGLWMPDVEVRRSSPDYTGHLYMSIKNVDQDRFRLLKCSICELQGATHKIGACIQCSGGRCRRSVHPYCARSRLKDPTKGEFVDAPSWSLLEMARSDAQFEYHCRCPAHALEDNQLPPPSGIKNICFLRARLHGGREIDFALPPNFDSIKGTRKGQKKGNRSRKQEGGDKAQKTGSSHMPISRFRGVWWSVMRYQWLASVQMNGVNVPLGYYENDADAAGVVDQFVKEQELNQPLNFPDGFDAENEERSNEEKKKKRKKSKKKVKVEEYVGHVEAILGRMMCLDGVIRYLVKWEGFEDIDNTWEPPENLDCENLVDAFEINLQLERSKRNQNMINTLNCFHNWDSNVWGQCPMNEIQVSGRPFVYVRSCVISSSLMMQNMHMMQEMQLPDDAVDRQHPFLKAAPKAALPGIPEGSGDAKNGAQAGDVKTVALEAKKNDREYLTSVWCYGTISMQSRCCCAECGVPFLLFVMYLGKNKGFGVVAGENIPAGSQVCEYVGELLEREVVRKREIVYKKEGLYYLFEPSHASFIIDATTIGGVARFINHSCTPNCKSKEIVQPEMLNLSGSPHPSPPRVVYVTNKDVAKGEELTIDYIPNYTEDTVLQKQVPCHCNSEKCRQWVL